MKLSKQKLNIILELLNNKLEDYEIDLNKITQESFFINDIEFYFKDFIKENNNNNNNNNNNINFEGLSNIKYWQGGGKKRLYFNAVGVPDRLVKQGKVFLELVNNEWIPNLKYNIIKNFANQLNNENIINGEKIEELYQEWCSNY